MPFVPAPGSLPFGHRVYAVGDVHGLAQRLEALHGRIAADFAARPIARATLVHVGDLIDRGPNSAGVVALLAGGSPVAGVDSVTLRGNHEDMLLRALDRMQPEDADVWRANGGAEALASWGLPRGTPAEGWASHIPPAHLAFLRGLPLAHRAGDYLFVHAGIRPGVALDRQDPHDMMWIRGPFLGSDADFGCVVVHGHTPVPGPDVRRNRIGIDTGAVMGGKLTCAVLEADRIGFIDA